MFLSANKGGTSMSIIATNVSSFEEIVSRHIKNVKEFGLKDLSNWLERLDASLYSDRPKHLKIIKIQGRTILTSIGLLSFKRRYYYDEINNQYLYLLDSFLKIPKRIKILDEVKYLLGGSKYEREKYDIDKTEMSYQTRKMFMKIEYGGN